MTKKEKRHAELVQLIRQQGMLPVRALAAQLGVSEMTVRRDLDELEWAPDAGDGEYSLLQAALHAGARKARIGQYAAALIEENDTLIIDTGSTTAHILPYLPENRGLTVLCYTANVLTELRHRPGIELMCCGGSYHRDTELLESPEGIQFIRRTRANKAFLSAAGVHRALGVTCVNAYEVPIKQAVIASSVERILVADSGKFGELRPAWFCNLGEVSTVVTDTALPAEWQAHIRELGITLHLV